MKQILLKMERLSKPIGIIYLIIAVGMLLNGIYNASESIPDQFNLYWMATGGAFLIGVLSLLISKGLVASTYISRILVGALFIVSGLIKANDTLGFSFKLEEYFAEPALNWPFWEPYSLPLSIFIAASEVVLGFAVLFGALIRLSSWALLGMILFFAWLTFFTADCNDTQYNYGEYRNLYQSGDAYLKDGDYEIALDKYTDAKTFYSEEAIDYRINQVPTLKQKGIKVQEDSVLFYMDGDKRINFVASAPFEKDCVTDCGCFGDALKGSVGRSLTPWESFFKDITLLIFVMPIFFMQGSIRFNSAKDDKIILPAALVFTIVVGGWLFGWWFPTIFTGLLFGIYLIIKRFLVKEVQVIAAAIVVILASFGFALYTINYLPIKDYRAYAIGNNINEKMNDGVDGVYNDMMVYEHKETKELLEIDQNEYMQRWKEIEAEYTFKDRTKRVVKEGVPNSISDFKPFKYYQFLSDNEKNNGVIKAAVAKIYDQYYHKVHVLENVQHNYTDSVLEIDYDSTLYPLSDTTWVYKGLVEARLDASKQMEVDFTQYLLSLNKVLFIISYDLDKTNEEAWKALAAIAKKAEEKGVAVYAITNGLPVETDMLNEEIGANIAFLTMDATELKILVRSNPGVLYLESGTVLQKLDFNSLENLEL